MRMRMMIIIILKGLSLENTIFERDFISKKHQTTSYPGAPVEVICRYDSPSTQLSFLTSPCGSDESSSQTQLKYCDFVLQAQDLEIPRSFQHHGHWVPRINLGNF